MQLKRIAAAAVVALALALATGNSLFSRPERADGSHESINLPAYDPARSHLGRDEVVFEEDFENNAEGWEHSDLTNPNIAFHKSDFKGRDDDKHWWAGDTITGYAQDYYGYDNIWLQSLDSPVLDLSNAGNTVTLSFDAWWLMEDPRRVRPPEGWDGWDGWIVEISTDGGNTFQVIRPTAPDYTCTHLSSAERFWHLEGDWPAYVFESKQGGIDAWDAVDDTIPEPEWVNCTFNLSNFRRNNVVIRFLVVSDRTVSAVFSGPGERNRYLNESGVLIDNISIRDNNNQTYLANNADDDPVPSDMIPRRAAGFGDHWALTRADVHSGTYAMWNDDDFFNQLNALDSPPFEVPAESNSHLEYWVHCDLPDAVHAGSQQLSDFYQIFISADNGATWTYFTHDYNRVEAGGDGWVHYVPGVPFAGNLDLALADYVGQTIQLRWLFTTDNDHTQGNGTGLFIDDIQVISENRQPRDAGYENLYIPYPLTVRTRLAGLNADLINYGSRDLASIWSFWGWKNGDYGRETRILPYPSVVAGDTLPVVLTDYIDRRNPGWTPTNPGLFDVYARTSVGAGTPGDDTDDDQATANDSTGISGVRVWPIGIYELGYDNRTYRFRFQFDAGFGAATRFSPGDIGQDNYSLASAHFLFNGGQEGTATFTLHVLGAGRDDSTPGQEITSFDVDVPSDSCLPGSMTVPFSHYEALNDLSGDFWIWAEITTQDGRPQIIGDELRRGAGRYFSYNGGNSTAQAADLMMHATIVPAANTAPNLAASEDMLDFGEVMVGHSPQRFISIYSTGRSPVTIQSVSSSDQSFWIDWPGETTLSTGQSIRFAIYFSPPDGEVHAADLVFQSTDETPPAVTIVGSGTLGVGDNKPAKPLSFGLADPYPNPFNSSARLEFQLVQAGQVKLALHDIAGRQIEVLTEGLYPSGRHSLNLQAGDLAAGVYLLRLDAGNQSAMQKVLLVK